MLFAEAISYHSGTASFKQKSIDCDTNSVWNSGTTIINYMRTVKIFYALTCICKKFNIIPPILIFTGHAANLVTICIDSILLADHGVRSAAALSMILNSLRVRLSCFYFSYIYIIKKFLQLMLSFILFPLLFFIYFISINIYQIPIILIQRSPVYCISNLFVLISLFDILEWIFIYLEPIKIYIIYYVQK